MKLVASLLVHNEMGRYLEPCVDQLLTFCDVVRALDDGSTDGSCEWLCEKPGVELVGGGPATFFQHEGQTRQELLEWTLDADPTHVLSIDADEFVSDGAAVRRACAVPGERVWTLEMREVWKADEEALWTREDGGWRSHPVPMLWRVPENMGELRDRDPLWRIMHRALACGREPQAVRMIHSRGKSVPSGADVLHFGWADPAGRQARYERYATSDGGRYHASAHLKSILDDDDAADLRGGPWPPSLSGSSLRP